MRAAKATRTHLATTISAKWDYDIIIQHILHIILKMLRLTPVIPIVDCCFYVIDNGAGWYVPSPCSSIAPDVSSPRHAIPILAGIGGIRIVVVRTWADHIAISYGRWFGAIPSCRMAWDSALANGNWVMIFSSCSTVWLIQVCIFCIFAASTPGFNSMVSASKLALSQPDLKAH